MHSVGLPPAATFYVDTFWRGDVGLVHDLELERHHMKNRFTLFQRSGVFYCEDTTTRQSSDSICKLETTFCKSQMTTAGRQMAACCCFILKSAVKLQPVEVGVGCASHSRGHQWFGGQAGAEICLGLPTAAQWPPTTSATIRSSLQTPSSSEQPAVASAGSPMSPKRGHIKM